MDKYEYFDKIMERKLRVDDDNLFDIYNTKFNFNVLALSLNGCLNIGNMIRTGNLNGVNKFIVFGKRKYEKKSAMNAQKYVNVIRISKDYPDGIDYNILDDNHTKTQLSKEDYEFDDELFIRTMESYSMIPVFIEQSKYSKKLSEIKWDYEFNNISKDKEICLIFGNEYYGIPKNILDTQKYFYESFSIEIEQTGIINSYNVSNCASIIMNSIFNYNLKKIKDIYL
jgi:tRNA G18 (ribose-2'-O)-methylase SpoU